MAFFLRSICVLGLQPPVTEFYTPLSCARGEVFEDRRYLRLLTEKCTGEDLLQRVLSRSSIFEQEAAVRSDARAV